MNKIVKLSDIHYIGVDDSEIKENQWYCNNKVLFLSDSKFDKGNNPNQNKNNKFVTHSTQPLSNECKRCTGACEQCVDDIKPLSLSEVEELIYGYSVEKVATRKYGTSIYSIREVEVFKKGFKAAMELTQDKLFTVEDMRKAIDMAREQSISKYKHQDSIIKSLLPKTQWEIEFDEQGKIKLI